MPSFLLPRLPIALLRAFLPRAERDEVLADVAAEYEHRAADVGALRARRSRVRGAGHDDDDARARRRDWSVVAQGATLALIGIAIGAVGAEALARLLTSFLFGVTSVDPIAFVAASVALLAIGMGAAFAPARRAGTVDPALVLREQ
ncbi:MAG: permease [Gemmatimonadetes bacterium]|nr:permease [Gemmatimonadota bacterium]